MRTMAIINKTVNINNSICSKRVTDIFSYLTVQNYDFYNVSFNVAWNISSVSSYTFKFANKV
jgi:hypothetical protein